MFESKINRGRANGYAPLNGDGKVGLNYLPDVVGVAGTSGTSGVNGVNGSQGSSGASGTNGTSGTSPFAEVNTGSFATTGSNIFRGNQNIIGNINLSGSLNISSSMIISSTVVNNGNINALNSDLIIDGGDLIVSGGSYFSGSLNLSNGLMIDSTKYGPTGDITIGGDSTYIRIDDGGAPPALIIATDGGENEWYFGLDGNLTTPGDIVLSGGNINLSGSLILSSSNIPTNLTGSLSDINGTIKIDNNSIYYCSGSFVPETYQIIVNESIPYSTHVSIPKNQPEVPNLYSNGFSITTSGNTTYVLTGVYSDGDNWDCEIDNLNSNYLGGTQTMTLTWLDYEPTNIWTKTDFGFERGKFATTGSNTFVGNQTISGSLNVTGSVNVNGSIYKDGNKQFNYGQWASLETQTGSANTAYPMKLEVPIPEFEGIYVGNNASGFPTRIYAEHTGLYNIQFSAQLHTTSNESADFSVWFAMTGSNIANSNTDFSIEKVSGGGFQVAALNFLTPITSGSYVELYWSKTTANGQLQYKGTQVSPTRPATPSVIVTVTQVA